MEASADVPDQVVALTGGVGADAVLLTLSSSSDEPVRQAAAMSRKRGRLVLVGVSGLELVRDDFYQKELSFAVSCSYGPGRYDPDYEDHARDYPLPFVRWTEQRNFQAVLGLMAGGSLDPAPLITHRFPFEEAPRAYDLITGGSEPSLAVVLEYGGEGASPLERSRTLELRAPDARPAEGNGVGVIGAGNFAVRTLLPALKEAGARFRVIASGGGTSGAIAGRQFDFERTTTDLDDLLGDPEVGTVFVLTRHDSHARLAIRALEAGKHVFVEKPLALSEHDLDAVAECRPCRRPPPDGRVQPAVRPLTATVRNHLGGRAGPLAIIATINAGAIPRDHWTQDPTVGGGRIVGEAVHWIDLARSLVAAPIDKIDVVTARDSGGRPIEDTAHLTVSFDDGSTAAIHYLANGAGGFPKERIECFWDGKTVGIDNWRRLHCYGVPGPLFRRLPRMDKGHAAEVKAWMEAVRTGGRPPIPLAELEEVSRWGIQAAERARSGSGT